MNQSHKDLQRFLMASYAYYHMNASVMSDSDYDNLARKLLTNFDEWQDHPHSFLVDRGSLEAGTLYTMSKQSCPNIIKSATKVWVDECEKEAANEVYARRWRRSVVGLDGLKRLEENFQ